MLKKLFRLSKVVKTNKAESINSPLFTLKIMVNGERVAKFAFVISKKIDKRAVVRNKLKRNISHFLEKNITNILPGQSYIFIVKKEILEVQLVDLEKELLRIFTINKLLK